MGEEEWAVWTVLSSVLCLRVTYLPCFSVIGIDTRNLIIMLCMGFLFSFYEFHAFCYCVYVFIMSFGGYLKRESASFCFTADVAFIAITYIITFNG